MTVGGGALPWGGYCPPGGQYRTPHNHDACVGTWPEQGMDTVPGKVVVAGGADGMFDQVGGPEVGAGPAWGEDPQLFEGVSLSLGGGTLKYKLLSPQGRAPRRGYAGDAGLDLAAAHDVMVYAGRYAKVELDIAVQLPEMTGAFMMSRSSLAARELWLMQTLIDEGYRGPLFCMVYNIGESPQMIRAGERVAQLVPFEAVGARLEVVEVEELDPSERGVNGFGSSGR